VADHEVRQLARGFVIGELGAGLGDLPELVVHALDRLRGVDDAPDIGRQACEAIAARDEDVADATVSQLSQDPGPKTRTLGLLDPHPENL
jgi:hypothetical protein